MRSVPDRAARKVVMSGSIYRGRKATIDDDGQHVLLCVKVLDQYK